MDIKKQWRQNNVKILQKIAYNAWLKNDFGMTECAGPLITTPVGAGKLNSVGKVLPWIQWKVVDINTKLELGPHQNGELWTKGPTMFKVHKRNIFLEL